MTLNEIKTAVDAGKTVHWSSDAYRVIKSKFGEYMILCDINENCIGLTWRDGFTLNGNECEFYISRGAK